MYYHSFTIRKNASLWSDSTHKTWNKMNALLWTLWFQKLNYQWFRSKPVYFQILYLIGTFNQETKNVLPAGKNSSLSAPSGWFSSSWSMMKNNTTIIFGYESERYLVPIQCLCFDVFLFRHDPNFDQLVANIFPDR